MTTKNRSGCLLFAIGFCFAAVLQLSVKIAGLDGGMLVLATIILTVAMTALVAGSANGRS